MHATSASNLVLIGYRGCGKTTVGRRVADALSLSFVDTDEIIVAESGRSIAELFAAEGEAGFRRREAAVIGRVCSTGPAVISVGGGAAMDAENVRRLRAFGRIVWLTCSAEELSARIAADPASVGQRPDLAGGGPEEVRRLLAAREPTYRSCADRIVNTEDRAPENVAAEIVAWIRAGAADRGG